MIRMVSPTQLPNLHHVSCIHCLHAFLVHFKLKICTSLDIILLLFPEPFNKTTTYDSLACLYLAACTDLDSLQAGTDSIMNVKSHIRPCHLYLGSCPNVCGCSGPILGPQLSLLSDYYLLTCALVCNPTYLTGNIKYPHTNYGGCQIRAGQPSRKFFALARFFFKPARKCCPPRLKTKKTLLLHS